MDDGSCLVKLQLPDGVPPFRNISQNLFSGTKVRKLKEEDIAVCECKNEISNPGSACGESCLNVLTSTECTPGYCPCGDQCNNQKFQKSDYAKTELFKTDGRGWGLRADQRIMAGQFIIEYCGEVISSEEAKTRSQNYENEGLRDAYIISLDGDYYIDATKKGSLARFINHSCEPNCETRKWTVLGDTRVGIFAKKDISVGTELTYDYNFEWYGGATVRCLCGADKCSLFLGAKSHGFQEHNHVWEDGDNRYTVENVPLYDSAEDEPFQMPSLKAEQETNAHDASAVLENNKRPKDPFLFSADPAKKLKEEEDDEERRHEFLQRNPMINRLRSNTAGRNYNIGPKRSHQQHIAVEKQKARKTSSNRKHGSSKPVAELFSSKKAQEEIKGYEELRKKATADLDSLYDEIRPAIEQHERDNQDSVPTDVAHKWIQASCAKLKADFNYHFSFVKNVMCPPPSVRNDNKDQQPKPSNDGGNGQNE